MPSASVQHVSEQLARRRQGARAHRCFLGGVLTGGRTFTLQPPIRPIELGAAHGGKLPQWADSLENRVGGLLLAGRLKEADALLRENPRLIHDDEAGWGDGVLAGPAHGQRHDVIEPLMRHGARVPKVTKWAPEYCFKHYGTAKFLLEHGMDPGGMNWHRLTLLHHFAMKGDADKVKVLLEHGTDIDAIDDEYRSTSLGVAARNGQRKIVELLLAHGADPEAAGAEWAKPRAWAERRGHAAIAALLARRGDDAAQEIPH